MVLECCFKPPMHSSTLVLTCCSPSLYMQRLAKLHHLIETSDFQWLGNFGFVILAAKRGDPFHIGTSFFVLLGTFRNNWRVIFFLRGLPFARVSIFMAIFQWFIHHWIQIWSRNCDLASHKLVWRPEHPARGARPCALHAEGCGRSMKSSAWKEIKVPLLKPPSLSAWGKPTGWRSVNTPGLRPMDVFTAVLRGPCGRPETSPQCPHGECDCVIRTWHLLSALSAEVKLCFSCATLCWRLFGFYCFCVLMLRKQWFCGLHPLLRGWDSLQVHTDRDFCCFPTCSPSPSVNGIA